MKRFRAVYVLGLGLIAAFVVVRGWDPFLLQVLRLKFTFDVYQQIQPREQETPLPVAVVDLDEVSLDSYGQWPWSRALIADLVLRLFTRYGIAALAFDVTFPEPDRTSPAKIAERLRGVSDATRRELLSLPSNDEILAETIKQFPVVLGQSTLTEQGIVDPDRPPPVKATYAILGANPRPFMLDFTGMVRNMPILEQAAPGLGMFTVPPDIDGIIRNVPMVLRQGDVVMPALSIELLRVATAQKTIGIAADPLGIQRVFLKGFDIPTDRKGRVWIHFRKYDRSIYVSAKDILDGTADPDRLKGHLVVIGTSALGLLDTKSTPVDALIPGVDVHAQLLEAMLAYTQQSQLKAAGKIDRIDSPFLRRPGYTDPFEIIAVIVVGLILLVAVPVIGALWSLIVGTTVIGGLVGVSWYLFVNEGVLLDMVYPAVASFILYTMLTYLNYVRESAQKKQVRTAFAQYLSPALVEQLARNPNQLRLGGEMRNMTFLFSDIRGFTSISESFKSDPTGLTRLINRFLTPMTDLIMSRRGTIDKYMGDCIMAFWNAPLADDDHARHACDTALAMMAGTAKLNDDLKVEAERDGRRYVPIKIGIGINTGDCFVGNMGSDQRFDYSVIGDDVNLASRLEGQSKTYGVGIVIGQNTQAKADDFAALELDLIKVKGKAEAVRIFALLGDAATQGSPEFQALQRRHGEMLAAYRQQDWQTARAMATECRRLNGGLDGLYDLYEERIELFSRNPPGPGWDGVFVAETK